MANAFGRREYWHAIGSDMRFTPRRVRWFHIPATRREIEAERLAYVEGLRDANRIIEDMKRDVAAAIRAGRMAQMISEEVFRTTTTNIQKNIHARTEQVAPELNK